MRIPDVCVIWRGGAFEKVTLTPPLPCIEILSPERPDVAYGEGAGRVLAMGVKNLWVFDPVDRVAMTYSETGLKLVEGRRMMIPGTEIYLDLDEIFAELDD